MIDVHAHLGCPRANSIYEVAMGQPPPRLGFTCPATDQVNATMFAAIGPKLNALAPRLADMDAMGIAIQILSPNPAQFFYSAPAEVARDCARVINDDMAVAIAQYPDRFRALGTVPLQDTSMAITEMRRVVRDYGFRGIEIGTYVAGRELADPSLRPFFAVAEELDVVLFIHPLGFSHGERLAEHYLNNILGNPIESSIAIAYLIFGGVLDSHPNLKICVAHGGGFLPGYWGRMDHAWRVREDCRIHIDKPPSTYLRQIWLETLVFDKGQLDQLIQAHGAHKLCLGTDYPFDMSEADPQRFLYHLHDEDHRLICRDNAKHLFNL